MGLSKEKTTLALKSIVPAFLAGVVDKGSTPEGAASLVNIVNTHNFQSSTSPDVTKIGEGNEVINNIFGGNLNTVVAKVITITGVDSLSIKKMMSMIAPGIMGFIASKVKSENMGSTGLMNFLSSQKASLASFGALGAGAAGPDLAHAAPKFPARYFALGALVLLGLLFWWLGARHKSVATRVAPAPAVTVTERKLTLTTNDLSAFLASGAAAELPEHFQFQTLNFANAS